MKMLMNLPCPLPHKTISSRQQVECNFDIKGIQSIFYVMCHSLHVIVFNCEKLQSMGNLQHLKLPFY